MGQYHIVVNLDKRQYLKPTQLGDGLKLLEFGDGGATLTALAILFAKDNGRGLGDLHVTAPDVPLEGWEKGKCGLKRARTPHANLVGSWSGDRITIAGDYGDNLPGQEENLYYISQREYDDISAPMRELDQLRQMASREVRGPISSGLIPSNVRLESHSFGGQHSRWPSTFLPDLSKPPSTWLLVHSGHSLTRKL